MTVYIEYAFLENFLLNGSLLWLSFRVVKRPIKWGALLFSAALGGAFSLLFPLLTLPVWGSTLFKLAVGLLLPLIACGRRKKGWAGVTACFLGFTFLFGGILTGIANHYSLSSLKVRWVLISFPLLTGISLLGIEWAYAKKKREDKLFDCVLFANGKKVKARGFYDSGNLAKKGGIPVCFLAMDIAYDLFETELFGGGQGCDEMEISTLSGEKKLPVYLGELTICGEKEKRRVYFAPTTNMIGREYKVILHSNVVEGEE